MFLVPYRQATIQSAHSPESLAERLRQVTSPRQPWFRSLAGKFEFVGPVSSSEFRLTPVIRGRNTYLPWLRGCIHAAPAGSQVQIVQTLHPVAVGLLIGFFFVLPLVLGARVQGIAGAVIALLVFHCVMYFIGFLPEARRAEDRIRQLAA